LRTTTSGQVRSAAVVHLRSLLSGAVVQLLVAAGTPVSQGQPLLRLDPFPFELAVREAEQRVADALLRVQESVAPESLVTGHGPSTLQRQTLLARAGVPAAQLQLTRARYDLQRATVTSPVDGVVDQLPLAVGESVVPGQPLLTIVDTRRLQVDAQLLEHDLPLVREGGAAEIRSAAFPGRLLRGRIIALLPQVDSSARVGRAVVEVAYGSGLLPGMSAELALETHRLRARRLIPARALVERDGRLLVFVVRNGRAQWTYVTPGRSDGRETELLPDSVTGELPVREGEPVIVDGQLTLAHNARVLARPARPSQTDRRP
jgi:RND family efflux transporter MFP subunit